LLCETDLAEYKGKQIILAGVEKKCSVLNARAYYHFDAILLAFRDTAYLRNYGSHLRVCSSVHFLK
jgi:hypothetical protein